MNIPLKVTLSLLLLFSLFVVDPVVAGDDHDHYRPSETNASGDPSQEAMTAAAAKDLVTGKLPGQTAAVGFKHYAGYVTVNKTNGRALFYWFFESLTLPQEKPLLLWLNGGPGCSSVGYGESQEIGPFLIGGGDGPLLTSNPYSWNTEANILFLESPIGVGFSYSNTSTDFVNLGDELAANDAYTFLNNWFLKFPSYRNRSFYIAGESYAGQYIPVLADLILEKNKKSSSSNLSTNINLKGVMIGNPETSDAEDWRGMVDYAWSHAIISDETHKIITDNCNNFITSDVWNNKNCNDGVEEMLKQYDEIDIYSLYTPKCLNNLTSSSLSPSLSSSPSSSSHKMRRRRRGQGLLGLVGTGYDPCLDDYTVSYFKRGDVQKVLHASDGLHVKDWNICNDSIFNAWAYSNESVLPIYRKLIAAGQKILLYSGDTDGRVPVLSTRYSIAAMGLPITKPWAPWFYQKQVSGWVQEYKGLTFATVRGAGHDVPTFKPAESLALFSSFISGLPLPSRRGP